MRKSLIISIALHLAVLLWSVASFPSAQAFRVPQTPSIPVEIVTSAEISKTKAGQRKAKADKPRSKKRADKTAAKSKKPKRTKTARAAPPNRPKRKAKVAPKPKKAKTSKPRKPKKAAKKKPRVKQRPKKKVVAKKPAKSKSKRVAAKTKKKNFSADRIAALLNKAPDAGLADHIRAARPGQGRTPVARPSGRS